MNDDVMMMCDDDGIKHGNSTIAGRSRLIIHRHGVSFLTTLLGMDPSNHIYFTRDRIMKGIEFDSASSQSYLYLLELPLLSALELL